MDLKLTIYKESEKGGLVVDRVVRNNSAFVPLKVFTRLTQLINMDELPDTVDKMALLKIVGKIAFGSLNELNTILVLAFAEDGLKEEELENCDPAEMIRCVVDMLISSFRSKFADLLGG